MDNYDLIIKFYTKGHNSIACEAADISIMSAPLDFKISFIGESNSGKTFTINQLLKKGYESSQAGQTTGLSILRACIGEKRIALIDAEGHNATPEISGKINDHLELN